MKLLTRPAALIVAIGVIAAGSASAMIPSADSRDNALPDTSNSSKIISDLETGAANLPGMQIGSDENTAGQQPGTKELRDLVGKHFI